MTTQTSDGGPAFPVSTSGKRDPSDDAYGHQDSNQTWQFGGMTLRDYFAAKALASVIVQCASDTRNPGESHATYFARKSYELADALLKARGSHV